MSTKNSVWPSCPGETAALIRAKDWAATPLGPPDGWPAALRTMTEVVLQNPVAMALVWGEQDTLIYNDAYAVVAGSKHPAALGASVRDAWPETWEFNRAMLAACYAGQVQSYRGQHLVLERGGKPADSWFDLYYGPVTGGDGRIDGVLATVIETTDQVRQEQRQKEAERRLKELNSALDARSHDLELANRRLAGDMAFVNSLFQQSPSFMAVLLGPEHVFELANAPYRLLTGNRDLIGKPLLEALPEVANQGFVELLDQVYRSGEAYHGRHTPVLLDAGPKLQRRVLDFVYQPLKDDRGRTYGVFVEGSDVSAQYEVEQALRELNESLERKVAQAVAERITAEEALRQSHKMEAVGQLASGVAHDFNNVLQIISSNLQLMELDRDAGAMLRSRVANAIAAVERGSKLSSQLLAFARRQPLQPVATDLGRLLAGMEHLLRRALGDLVELDVEVEDGLWPASLDPNQIENAILNMAINARDAMDGAGRLSIRLANLADARAAGLPEGQYVGLTLADTGCGMPPEVLAKVFDPFYTTKEPGKGTGLGMSMVYGFVKQSGGEIRIDSSPGAGTSIAIFLPRAAGGAAALPAGAVRSAAGGDETVLVVEDDAAVRNGAADMLASLGYRALKAGNGEQALAILAGGVQVDLLFADVFMPGTVGTLELVRQAGALAPHTAVLLTSGHSLDSASATGQLPAGVELLPKPYGRAQLAASVRQQLDARVPLAASGLGAAALPTGALRILVVEDDPDARALACEMLAALGHGARGAGTASQALALLGTERFDVLFTDLNLPDLAGDRLAAAACAQYGHLRVILATGEGNAAPAIAGALLLPKPYDLLQLQLTIASIALARGAPTNDAAHDREPAPHHATVR